jgi:hypothetical protein
MKYLLTIVDDFTRYTWVILLAKKSDVTRALTTWATREQNQQSTTIKVLRTDRGREFVNKVMASWCEKHGISHEVSIQHNPQQNGVAERHNDLIFNIVRCQLHWSGLPLTWWGEAALTAADVINHWPRTPLNGGTPHYAWHGVREDASQLHPFGCVVHIRIDPEDRTDPKLGPRSKRCAHLGKAPQSKGWRVLDTTSNKVVHSRDAVFEDTVPFYTRAAPRELDPEDDKRLREDLEKSLIELPDESAIPVDKSDSSDEEDEDEDQTEPEPLNLLPEGDAPRDAPRQGSHPRISKLAMAARRLAAMGGQPRRSLRLQDTSRRALLCEALEEAALAAGTLPGPVADLPPRTIQQAMARPDADKWKEATDKEVLCIHKNNTYDLVSRDSLPTGANVLGNTWVFKIKTGGLYRARLCVRGDWQIEGVDFFEIFAPTARLQSLRTVLQLAATLGLRAELVDFVTAFMNGDLEEDVFMRQIPGYEDPERPNHVCKLKKALNGIRQAPRQWFAKLREALLELGFKATVLDPTIFHRNADGHYFIVVVFVDDLLITASEQAALDEFKKELAKRFEIKCLGPVRTYLGMEVYRDEPGRLMHLSQQAYINALIRRFGMEDARAVDIPITVGHDLTNPAGPQGEQDAPEFPHLVGALMYLMVCTRPDIAYAISVLSRFMAKGRHTTTHMTAARRVLRYLKQTSNLSLTLGGTAPLDVTAYADASQGDDKENGKSTLAFHISLGAGLVSWKSKLSEVVAVSTAEAEYYAAVEAAKEADWLTGLLDELGWKEKPYLLLTDSQSALSMIKNRVINARSKHIRVKFHFLREHHDQSRFILEYVPSADNLADFLTKALPADALRRKTAASLQAVPTSLIEARREAKEGSPGKGGKQPPTT